MILLLSNSRDFATDYVVGELRQRGAAYYRLDLDLLSMDSIALDPVQPRLQVVSVAGSIDLHHGNVTAVLYRAPTHLRESGSGRRAPADLLARHQWAAFARSLVVFDQAKWVNHPAKTYLAENKPYQLLVANRLGLPVPATLATNMPPAPAWAGVSGRIAVKALDSFLLRMDAEDAFFFTQVEAAGNLTREELCEMPLTVQHLLSPKLDIRVTVVGNRCFAASISLDGMPIEGDWRLHKGKTTFSVHELPDSVALACIRLVNELGLVFGAIDLALVAGRYYFLEVNPTGEWAWLVDDLSFPIHKAIADELVVA